MQITFIDTNTKIPIAGPTNPLLFLKAFMVAHKLHPGTKYSSYTTVFNNFKWLLHKNEDKKVRNHKWEI